MREALRTVDHLDRAKRPARIAAPAHSTASRSSDSLIGHMEADRAASSCAEDEGVTYEAGRVASEAAIAAFDQAQAEGLPPEAALQRARATVDSYDWANAPPLS
jgi:hypothetical protein